MRNRRYAEASTFARKAVECDSTSARALGILGTNQLRLGDIAGGRVSLERAFALDPYNIWNKNTLDMLDELAKATTVDRGRFRFVVPSTEADLLVMYLSPLLEQAYDTLSRRYDFRPPTPIRIEVFRRHADFSVRTVGLVGLGALGVSFGTTLAMDAPSARDKGSFNFGSTAWHELTHTFTLGRSNNRVPRWVSEGLSVFEERRGRPGWGADVTVEFLAAYKGGLVRKVSELNDGFMKPRYPGELQNSYYAASLVCEMIFAERGAGALVALLNAYGEGLDTPAAFQRVLGMSMDAVDKRFDAWMRARFALPMKSIANAEEHQPVGGPFVAATIQGTGLYQARKLDSARIVLERAESMFPEYSGANGPRVVPRERCCATGAIRAAQSISCCGSHCAMKRRGTQTRWKRTCDTEVKDLRGCRVRHGAHDLDLPLRSGRAQSIADAATRAGDHVRAIRERRAILALNPPTAWRRATSSRAHSPPAATWPGARREILGVLEVAPGFEKAQALLLELRDRLPREPNR